MKALKIIGIIVGVLVAVLLIVPLFLAAEYRVERSTVISASPEEVYRHIVDFNEWDSWSPWSPRDPEARITISEPGHGIGARMSWDGDVMGKGYLTIIDASEPVEIRSNLVFTDPYAMTSTNIWELRPKNGGTEVTWIDKGTLSWPVERWFGLFIDQQLGPDFEQGLENLKRVVERSPESP